MLMLHLVNFFTDRGILSTTAATIFASISMFATVGKLANEALADRIGGRQSIVVFLALQTAMVPCFFAAWEPWQYYVIAALFGIGIGVFTAMSATGMALGGYLGGLFHDRFDSYTEAFLLSLLAGTTATLLTFLRLRERRRVTVRYAGERAEEQAIAGP